MNDLLLNQLNDIYTTLRVIEILLIGSLSFKIIHILVDVNKR